MVAAVEVRGRGSGRVRLRVVEDLSAASLVGFIEQSVAPGSIVHTVWCKKHSIHPIYATPRRKYYELRGWVWPE